MEITLLQIVLVFIVACIAGMESVLDEFQFHRPLIACTLVGAILASLNRLSVYSTRQIILYRCTL